MGEREVLGVRINDVSEKEAIEIISSLVTRHSSLVFTPGPEFIVTAQKDPEFKKILNSSDLNVPDGFGLRFAGIKNRIAGVDLVVELCRVAARNNWSIGLLGGVGGVAGIAGQKLTKMFPKLKIKFALSDYDADNAIAKSLDSLDKVDFLFVGLGHPKQEKLLYKMKIENGKLKKNSHLSSLNFQFRVGMGVGGSFDLIAGIKKRAPGFISKVGLEWLWRGLQDPKHFGRVWKATAEYLWLLINNRES